MIIQTILGLIALGLLAAAVSSFQEENYPKGWIFLIIFIIHVLNVY